jgi:TBC1 domain family member 2
MLIRVLFVWTVRHPASGYVQGINDLCAPFILVFLSEFIQTPTNPNNIYDIQEKEIDELPEEVILAAEADCFWCLSKIIDDVQDNYMED